MNIWVYISSCRVCQNLTLLARTQFSGVQIEPRKPEGNVPLSLMVLLRNSSNEAPCCCSNGNAEEASDFQESHLDPWQLRITPFSLRRERPVPYVPQTTSSAQGLFPKASAIPTWALGEFVSPGFPGRHSRSALLADLNEVCAFGMHGAGFWEPGPFLKASVSLFFRCSHGSGPFHVQHNRFETTHFLSSTVTCPG